MIAGLGALTKGNNMLTKERLLDFAYLILDDELGITEEAYTELLSLLREAGLDSEVEELHEQVGHTSMGRLHTL